MDGSRPLRLLSLATLLQVAAQSCKFILRSYIRGSLAPSVRSRTHCITIKALISTSDGLATSWTGLPADITADAELKSALVTFIDEAREAEKAAAEVGRLLVQKAASRVGLPG